MQLSSDSFLLNPNYCRIPIGGKPIKKKGRPWGEFFLLMMVVLMLFTTAFSGYYLYRELCVWWSPRPVQAQVLSKWTTESDGTVYHVRYDYPAPSGHFTRDQTVGRAFYHQLGESGQVTVEYSTFDPSISYISGQANWWDLGLSLTFSLTTAGLLSWLTYKGFKTHQRHKLCLQNGRTTKGRATSITGSRQEDGFRVTVGYEFDSPKPAAGFTAKRRSRVKT